MGQVSIRRLGRMKLRAGFFFIIAFSGSIIICPVPAEAQKGKAEARVEYVGADYRDPLELPPALRAPVAPPVEEVLERPGVEVELPPLKVEGMVWGSERPQAIIDGEVFDIGDTVNGAKILDISKDGVILLYKNRSFVIRPKIKVRNIGEGE